MTTTHDVHDVKSLTMYMFYLAADQDFKSESFDINKLDNNAVLLFHCPGSKQYMLLCCSLQHLMMDLHANQWITSS